MPVRAQIRGSQRLYDKWKRMAVVAQGRTLERALTAGAVLIQNGAKRRATYRTGNLRRSIHIGGHEDLAPDNAGVVNTAGQVSQPVVREHHAEVFVGTNVEYARRIEYGFQGADSLGRNYSQAAQPYLRPAVDEEGRAAQREAVDALAELMRKAMD